MSITDKDLESGLLTAAKVVEAHGDVYLPIFVKLSDELERRQSQRAKVTAHLRRCRTKKLRRIKKTDMVG